MVAVSWTSFVWTIVAVVALVMVMLAVAFWEATRR